MKKQAFIDKCKLGVFHKFKLGPYAIVWVEERVDGGLLNHVLFSTNPEGLGVDLSKAVSIETPVMVLVARWFFEQPVKGNQLRKAFFKELGPNQRKLNVDRKSKNVEVRNKLWGHAWFRSKETEEFLSVKLCEYLTKKSGHKPETVKFEGGF